MYKSTLLDIESCRLLFPLDGFSEDEPLLVELFDQDFRAKEFLGQVGGGLHTVVLSQSMHHLQLPMHNFHLGVIIVR
jgi:hypothetical protein